MNTCIDFAEQSGDIVMVIVKIVIFKNITQRTDLQNLTRRMTMAEKEYIEREALLKKACELRGGSFSTGLIIEQIEKAPTADVVEVKHGEWLSNAQTDEFVCSECDGIAPVDCEKEDFYESNFCPNCGAKMDLEERLNEF